MANAKISALTDGNPAQSGDEIPIARSGANYKITVGSITSLGGDVDGPASSTDNAVARFDGTTGKLIQNSGVTIEDDGSMVIPANSTNAGLRITQTGSGNALSVEDSANPDATPFVVDASGNVGIGNTAANVNDQVGFVRPLLVSTSDSVTTIAGSKASIVIGNADTTTSNTSQLSFAALTGANSTYFVSAAINCIFGARTNGQYSTGQLVFSTSTTLNSAPTEKMRIDNAGNVGIGGTASTVSLYNAKNITGGTFAYAFSASNSAQSDVTNTAAGYHTSLNTADAAFTLTNLSHFWANQGTVTGGSRTAPTNQFGFSVASSLTGATNNYGFYSDIASGTGRWNFYANGTATNYFGGNIAVGSTTVYTGYGFTPKVQVVGASVSNSSLLLQSTDRSVAFPIVTFGNASSGNNGLVSSGDILGQFRFYGGDGSSPIRAAQISVEVDGTPGTNDMPGRLVFYTTAAGASSPTDRMRIDKTGAMGIGTSSLTGWSLRVSKNITGGTSGFGVGSDGAIQSDVTSSAAYFRTSGQTAAAVTLSNLYHYDTNQGTFNGTVTNQYGFIVQSTLTGATNNYGFYSNIASGTGRWNFYANGTAANYFAGDMQLDKTVTAAGTTGAQTINKNAGTVNFAAAATSLVVTDSRVTANSIIICTVGTNDTTMKSVAAVAGAGSFTLHANAAATAETRVNFLIIN